MAIQLMYARNARNAEWFCIAGQIFLSANSVQEILTAADMLGIFDVVESCTDYLKSELHPSNAVGIYRFAEGHNCETLEKVALSYVHRHFPQVCESEEFLDTPKDIIVQFLESEHVKVDSEFQVSRSKLHIHPVPSIR